MTKKHLIPSLLAALLCCLAPVRAADAPDSPPADSLAGPSPRAALLRSALVPGWGQYYNGKPVKALLFGGAAFGLAGLAIDAARSVDRAPTAQIHQDRAARRNTRILYVALAATLAAVDAFVDAHLAALDTDYQSTGHQNASAPSFTLKPLDDGAMLQFSLQWPSPPRNPNVKR